MNLRLGVNKSVRALNSERTEWGQNPDLQTEDGQRILSNIKVRRQRFEPEMEAKGWLLVLAGQGRVLCGISVASAVVISSRSRTS
ncbi:hypothetical protein [Bradyrhizobium ottawaense]|uniref:hypothetical protein n=1 Tax=Bradyrhizobium ottawaense TaxID=931866 RepID=UPI003513780D